MLDPRLNQLFGSGVSGKPKMFPDEVDYFFSELILPVSPPVGNGTGAVLITPAVSPVTASPVLRLLLE